jgi:predicted short-subunit dehydrogenase-like oxidoreductase (DUF2520 family)
VELVIVGAGRAGTAVRDRAVACGVATRLVRRVTDAAGAQRVLLAVPDRVLAECAAAFGPGIFVGTLSGATPLAALGPGRGRFAFHPAQTLSRDAGAAQLDDATVFVTAASDAARRYAVGLASSLRLRARVVTDAQRLLEHAACVVASNYLVTLTASAIRILQAAGLSVEEARGVLAPLVTRTARITLAPGAPLTPTGPVARGDAATVHRHQAALSGVDPSLAGLYTTLARATLPLVGEPARSLVAAQLESAA